MSTEDIVQVGREAARRAYEDVPGDDIFLITAEAVIAAVRPLIEARQRARASAEIGYLMLPSEGISLHGVGWNQAVRRAVRIVENPSDDGWVDEAVERTSALADTFRRRVADGTLVAETAPEETTDA